MESPLSRFKEIARSIFFISPTRKTLPVRLPSSVNIEVDPVFSVLQGIWDHNLLNLYALDKALLLLDPTGSKSTNTDIPQTFGTSLQLDHIADAEIAHKIRILYDLRHSLAAFLSQLYLAIDEFGKTISTSSEDSLLVRVNGCFLKLEESIRDDSLVFAIFILGDQLPEDPYSLGEITDSDNRRPRPVLSFDGGDTSAAVTLIHENLIQLDMYISMMVSKYSRPRKKSQHWMLYTFGAIGISLFSVWLIRSGIVNNWVFEAKKIFSGEQAVTSVRDDLLEKMRKREKEKIEQVRSTSNALHSMLLDISERIKGEKSPSNMSENEMLEMATTSFEEQLKHPIRNFIWGELPRLLHIQILRKTNDIEASMCELNHEMLMENHKIYSLLTSLPTIFVSFGVLMISRAWVKQTKAKEKSARVQRRLLIKELEERIMELDNDNLSPPNEHGHHVNGLVLYTLDRLYRVVERHAKATGEWPWVRYDIIYLGDPSLATSDKLTVTTRLKEMYRCLFPLTRRELIQCIDDV